MAGEKTKEKPTFTFIHGGAGFLDHSPYVKFWSRFADVAEVIFVDMRGSGRSICDDETTWNLEQWGQDVYQFCEELHIEKPIVGGISYGGMVAMSYNIQYPNHPKALILSDTDVHIDMQHVLYLTEERLKQHGKPVEELLAVAKQMFTGPITDELFTKYFYDVLNLFGEPDAILDDFSLFDPNYSNKKLGEMFMTGELLSFDYRDKLKQTRCPVLFLSGDQGPLHSLKTAKELIAAFPDDKIQYKIFENAKPACYEFYPKEAEKIVKDFINSVNSEG